MRRPLPESFESSAMPEFAHPKTHRHVVELAGLRAALIMTRWTVVRILPG